MSDSGASGFPNLETISIRKDDGSTDTGKEYLVSSVQKLQVQGSQLNIHHPYEDEEALYRSRASSRKSSFLSILSRASFSWSFGLHSDETKNKMGTRAAAFTAKIRNLQDYHSRLTNGIMPLPTGLDIANTLKHFSQTLLAVMKDVPQYPLEMLKQRSEESARMQLFPNLDYNGLFSVVVQLIDVTPSVQLGIQSLGQAILQTISSLLPFLEHEHIDTLPYIVATSLGTFPSSLHKDIIDLLCHYLFPFTLYNCDQCPDKAAYAMQSVSAVLMMVLKYTSSSEYHCQILEAVMCYKRDSIKDLLCVIAYGTVEARKVGMKLLVYYWPHVNPTLYDRRNVNFNFNGYKIPNCRSEMCSVNNTRMCVDAAKVCFDHSVGISLAPENPPPLFLCQECASRLQSEQPTASEHLYDILLPIMKAGTTCENKNCRSQGPDKVLNAVICFHAECASYNGNRPIRYCSQCHSIRHNNRRGLDHVFHKSIQAPDSSDTELLNYHVEAVVSSLLEAEPLATRGGTKDVLDQQTRLRLFTDGEFTDPIPIEERRLLGRFGIWLLVGFFNPEDDIMKDVISRLLSSLFQWFNTTAYLGNDPSANALERLKVDVVCPWLKKVIKFHFETFVTCLLPHPPDYARVGGHWDVISSRTYHLREGFNRLFCLVPYEVISPEIWSQIMPHWMESMASEVPEEEMGELKIILSKVMDPEMNPLGSEARQMYQFIAVRFHQTSHKVKEQALKWLQVLSKLEIVTPLYFIFSVFREGIRPKMDKVPKRGSVSQSGDAAKDVISAICQDDSPNASSLSDDEDNIQLHTEQQSDSELMLSSFIFMLDIILKQLELQEVEQHKGLQTLVAKDAMVLLHNMVAMPWPGTHTCQQGRDCQFCEMAVLWYQLALEIVQKLAPENSALAPDVILSPDGEFGGKGFLNPPSKQDTKCDSKPAISPKSESRGLEGIIVNMPQILTATVETVSEIDLGPLMGSSDRTVKAVARAVTITDSDTANATAQVQSTPLMGDGDVDGEDDRRDSWVTTVGKFRFLIDELPPFLQFTYELLKKIPDEEDPEVMHNMLKCLRIMFLHGEVFMKASKDHRGFVIWCQENLIIKNLWELMDAEYSHICEQAVPILLHCITLPVGADMFWKQIQEEFESPDWRRRFTAVERIITITRFMDSHPVRNSQALQTALANAFCYVISSLDDSHVSVAQRAALYLGTIHDSAFASLMYCLEAQFDTVIIDRPVILQSLYVLLNSVSDRKILRWDFFLNCFDTLFLEAQITLERLGDITLTKDVRNIEGNLDNFIRKLGRVHEALMKHENNYSAGSRTLYASLGSKMTYKRTMSAPGGLHAKPGDKGYYRQSSAPTLKRKGSRHGVEGYIHGLMGGDDGHLLGIFHRIIEIEEQDKETMHLLTFIFMQFLSRYNRGVKIKRSSSFQIQFSKPIPSDNKALAKTQNVLLRHITMLLGYNSNDKTFFIPPTRMRSSPVFNSFVSTLPQVLDQNFSVGGTLLPLALTILQYCPASSKNAGQRAHPSYSLWYLEPHVRRSWLMSLIVILYKYDYGSSPLSVQVQNVIRIVLNTLNHMEHKCRPLPSTLILDEPIGRSRDISRTTLGNLAGDLEHITEHETPPITPLSTHNMSPSFSSTTREARKSVSSITSVKKEKKGTSGGVTESFDMMSSTEDPDDIEPELAAIPESPRLVTATECSFTELALVESSKVVATIVHPSEEFQTIDQLQSFQPLVISESPKIGHSNSGSAPLSASASEKSKSIAWFIGSGATSETDNKSSSSGGSTSSKSGGTIAKAMGGEFPWHLSVQAALQIAKIPAPRLERLLPVGFNAPPLSPTVKSVPRVNPNGGHGSPYESPESPMSRMGNMGMITIGPTVRIDEGESGGDGSESEQRPHVERLLSLGGQGQDRPFKPDDHAKGLHKTEYGNTSPKKLVKQPNVIDADVFEGAQKTCLVPYEVISPEIWSQIMPHWMESMASEVPEEEMGELKIILSKVMDPEMNPLGSEARQMYQFIAVRFHQTSHKVKEQALKWLQVLSKLEIVTPLYFIFSVFREGIRPKMDKVPKRVSVSQSGDAAKDVISAICQDDSPNASSLSDDEDNIQLHTEQQSDSELMLSSFIFMLDIILKQLELQEVEQHKGLQTLVAKDAMVLLHNMVAMPWPGTHTCQQGRDCQFCEMAVLWYQLALEIVQKLAPENSALAPDVILSPDGEFGGKGFLDPPSKQDTKCDSKPAISPKSESRGLEGIIVNMPQILTATVETVSEIDLGPLMGSSDRTVKAVARAVTITDSDTANATAQVQSTPLMGDGDVDGEDDRRDSWVTTVGKFRFLIDELPPFLQFTYELLKKIPDEEDPEVMHNMLKCLRIMFLHGEVFMKASKDHRGFVIWCQENLIIKNLWELMDAEYSHICEQAVPILLHCITLPVGADMFWKQIQEEFESPDWRRRFTAVERIITITRFMDSHPVRNSQALQTALANAFCYVISSLDDSHVSVAQRAALYLGTIHDSAFASLMYCLEAQFDTVIIDRPVILQSLYVLLNSVSDRKILRWDFFLNCFDTLFLEAQITLERLGDITLTKDVRNIEGNLDNFIRKLGRVHEALMKHENNYSAGSRTLYASLGSKMTYKRTMSAPGGLHAKPGDKGYYRQSSAPTLKRKGSRHGVEGYIHGLMGGDDGHLLGIFHRIIEIEEQDKETMHLLTFIFMQFLSRYNRGVKIKRSSSFQIQFSKPIPSDNKALAKTQNVLLRHITMLLGYNSNDKTFFIPPTRMRSSPVFNSFVSTLPQVLDQNFSVGGTLLPLALTILQYCPASSKNAGQRAHPSYSLWYLEPHVRRSWLMSLIVILYKYDYGSSPLSVQVQNVIRIVLNTLNHMEHKCRPLPSTLILDEPIGRSRDISRTTLGNLAGDLEHITEHETPPITPLSTHNMSPSFSSTTREARKSVSSITSVKKEKKGTSGGVTESFDMMSSTEDPDDIEPELAAIPESPRLVTATECSFTELALVESSKVVATIVHPSEEFQTIDQLQSFQPLVISESPKIGHSNSGSAPLSASASEKSKSIAWFIGSGATSETDNKSSSSGGSTSSKSGGIIAKAMGGEFPWHLSVQAALQIAKIPAPPLERLLPVGFNAPPLSPTVKSVPRVNPNGGHGSPYESPESPMSRMGNMGMITIGPTVRIDEGESGGDGSESEQRPHVERLLSLGGQGQDRPFKPDDHAKGLHKTEYGNTSPKKLVKQPNVIDADVFEGAQKTDDAGNKKGGGGSEHDGGKSVGFAGNIEGSGQPSRYTHQHLRQSCLRVGEDCVQERCGDCGVLLESYTNDELGLCIVALETFIHREPSVAAPSMPEILKVVARLALKPLFPWQVEGSSYFPGAVSSVAHQFLRCVLHQLAPYGVFVQLFQTKFPAILKEVDLFKSISLSLADFAALNPVAPLQMLFETLNARKSIVMDTVAPIIDNIATYMECLPLEAASATWSAVIPLSEAFLRKVLPLMQNLTGMDGILRTMACLMRLPGISAFKSILDPFSKILSFVLGNLGLKYNTLVELCHLCHRGFMREREKLLLTRVAVLELVQALKFKTNIPDSNLLTLVTFVLQDAGGSLAPFVGTDDFPKFPTCEPSNAPTTGAAECMRQHLTDSLEFLADFHSLSKIKSNYKGNGCGLNEDTLGGVIKGGVSQFIALEISRGNSRENRAIGRHLPWLYNPPSAIQQGPKEFLDCVSHIQVLSWLLLGALTHTAMFGPSSNVACVPIPLEASCHVADQVHVIMTGFAEQSKASVLHMSSLFHAFILCQVWTIYLEQVGPAAQTSNSSDPANVSTNILTDFWGKVTPAILQLISHSKVLAEMVNLHFLSLLESLLECNSSVFSRLLPLWNPVLYAHHGNLPAHVQVRLQTCLGYPPPDFAFPEGNKPPGKLNENVHGPHSNTAVEFPSPTCGPIHNLLLLKWVQRLQFKMGQIELQSSAATQFYPL